MIDIDGSEGEGGGQILRSALALSIATRTPFRIHAIRARREKPGLLRQHLAAVLAAAEVGAAEVQGASLGSRELVFRPTAVVPGHHAFEVGSAGSACLVLQTVLPPLLLAEAPSHLLLGGGTHNRQAPPYDFLERAFLPLVSRMGPQVEASLVRPGFYPAGGGVFEVHVRPAPAQRLVLEDRGPLRGVSARALVSNLPPSIADRELAVLAKRLAIPPDRCEAVVLGGQPGPGNAVLVDVAGEHVTEVFVGFGERGVPAEQVAEGLADEVSAYLASSAPVGEHLADQLFLPLALLGGGSFVAAHLSLHATTNVDVIRRFVPVEVGVDDLPTGGVRVTVTPP